MNFHLETIGIIHSCFKEKFGIPRQSLLAPSATATLELLPPFDQIDAVDGIEEFSHLWLTFIFHKNSDKGWKPKVRPPRLGGNKKIGVFATRSTFRPNSLGLSAVKLEKVDNRDGKVLLHLSGIDIVDGTPVVDIKPYLPYSDTVKNAVGGFANHAPIEKVSVVFTKKSLADIEKKGLPVLKKLIKEILLSDPRPAYYNEDSKKQFGIKIFDFDIKWEFENNLITVLGLE
ncbi:MAG: tRNA (N6-threonylcarbamoyladenosine(37)-N6)-methyltransferase TrmO [Desulfobacterales bacterium]|nr:tRNA (N6-threonylcarbamoyladenosine(37)-N6)-methyltransferase TrmO [Desulfobacterales bacterium]MCP4161290.1 tRNA (N6-threonylcarbamoyladenosine(37)-N6)-methyltransferase TrmO [Deltaproteobacteria bacterium]